MERTDFGKRLRELRERECLTLSELAALAGLDRQGLHRLESGRTTPRLGTLEKLAGIFHVTLDVMAGRVEVE